MRIVIALGGNALLSPSNGSFSNQKKAIEKTANVLAEIAKKHEIIITHGNGPQVGELFEQQKLATTKKPLDVCGAESQAQIGYLLQQALRNEFIQRKLSKNVSVIISQVEVMSSDPAFKNPLKPIGRYYSVMENMLLKRTSMKYFKGKGYRKVVPSPKPVKILELSEIEHLIENNYVIICCGGGGIPVIRKNKQYFGIEAVIDKDRTAALLARKLDADMLMLLTNVDAVFLNYNKKNEKRISEISERNLHDYMLREHFGEGSMKPKVEAAIDFVSKSKKPAIIANLSNIKDAINMKNCTVVRP